MTIVHFGVLTKTTGRGYASFNTLCGLEGDCNNRDPNAVTCKACRRSNFWEEAVASISEAKHEADKNYMMRLKLGIE